MQIIPTCGFVRMYSAPGFTRRAIVEIACASLSKMKGSVIALRAPMITTTQQSCFGFLFSFQLVGFT